MNISSHGRAASKSKPIPSQSKKSRTFNLKSQRAEKPDFQKGHLITFEGIEGSGKTSQVARAAERLEQHGWKVLKTREPGGTKLGEMIRHLLLDTQHLHMSPKTELLLYLASRAQHIKEIILPALQHGKVILCDRYADATLAYQGYGRQLDLGMIKALQRYVTDDLKPDLTFLLDVEARRGLLRISTRNSKDRLEQERVEFYEKVRQGYLHLAKMRPRQIVVIDANQEFEKVAHQVCGILETFLEKNVISKDHRS